MNEEVINEHLQAEIDKYIGKIELLLINVPRHLRNDYVNELEDYLVADYQNQYDDSVSENENIKNFIKSLDSPEKAVDEFLHENNFEKLSSNKSRNLFSFLSQRLEQKPLQTISILSFILGLFVLLPAMYISISSFNTTTGTSEPAPFLLFIFLTSFIALIAVVTKNIGPNNWTLKILSIPLITIFTVLPLYLLENFYIIFNGSSYTTLTDPYVTKGITIVELPHAGHIFIDRNSFFISVVGVIVFMFCLFFIFSTMFFFLIKRSYRSSIARKSFLSNVLGVIIAFIFIISIFSPPISIDQNFVIDPTKDSGSYYVTGSDWFIQNYQDVESRIQHANVYDSNIFTINPSYIYQLRDKYSLDNVINPTENLITNYQRITWKLPYATKNDVETHINQINGKTVDGYTYILKIVGNLYFEYRVTNSSFIAEVYSISTSDLLYISSNLTPSTVGLGYFAYTNVWYLWKIDIYSRPYKYPLYYAILNILVIIIAYVCILYYSKYLLKHSKK